VAPRSANVPAMAAPIPLDEPVTRATRPPNDLGPINDSTSALSSTPFTSTTNTTGRAPANPEGSAYGIIRHPAVDDAGSVVAKHNGDVGALEVPLEPVHHGALAARRRCARCALVSGASPSFLHFLYEPSGHDSTVSRCATGSNPRNPQSQRGGPRGARTRTVWYDARSAAGKGKRVLGRSRWDCGLRRCEARRWASGIRSQLRGRITPRVRDERAASGCSPPAFDTPCSGGTRRCAG
jgi:hypothetical protein